MARLRFLKTIHRKTALIAFALLVIVLSATSTRAGFEWVPGTQQGAAPVPVQNVSPPPMPPSSDNSITVLPLAPMPGLETSETPQRPAPAPVVSAPAPRPSAMQTIQVQQPLEATPDDSQPAQVQRVAAPKPSYQSPRYAQPQPAPETSFYQSPIADRRQAPVAAPKDAAESLKIPPRVPENTKIIVPDDAPGTAKSLDISSFPGQQDLAITQEDPMFLPRPAEPVPAVSSNSSGGSYEVVEGFGSDVPLALALRQVVPAAYSFSFGTSVNPGYRVSWSGGKPWDQVVRDMVSELGYGVQLGTKTVFISAQQNSAIQTPAALAPLGSDEPGVPVIEPASGDAAADIQPVAREREVRRISVTDPGDEQQEAQPETALQKMAAAANKATKMLGFSGSSGAVQTGTDDAGEAWSAAPNDSLKDTLERWSKQAGVQLVWDVAYDYPIAAPFEVQGSFEAAVQSLLQQNPDALAFKLLGNTPQQQLLVQDRA